MDHADSNDGRDAERLRTYLRDHYAGSSAGLALAHRCRAANEGTDYEPTLRAIETEIARDRRTLEAIMERLGVTPSAVKAAIGSMAETVGRLKINGHLVKYSPSSRVIELEGLAAGIVTKRSLWRALRAVAPHDSALRPTELEDLIERATSQFDRVVELHARASVEAFAPASAPVAGLSARS